MESNKCSKSSNVIKRSRVLTISFFFLEKRYFTTISMGACVSFLDNEPICSKKKKKRKKNSVESSSLWHAKSNLDHGRRTFLRDSWEEPRRGLCGSVGTMYTFHCNYFALTNSPSVNEKGLLMLSWKRTGYRNGKGLSSLLMKTRFPH